MAKIMLTRGYYTIVDDEDVDYLYTICNSWFYMDSGKGYAAGYSNGKTVYMHRILGEKMGLKGRIDHEDNNGLNNRKGNLREATKQQNAMNRGSTLSKTGYKGVSWHKGNKKYIASIKVDGISKFLGYYDDPVEAHEAYRIAAKEEFGDYANFGYGTRNREEYKEEVKPVEYKKPEIILTPEEEAVELTPANNSTGYKGIEYKPQIDKYKVEITQDKQRNFGGHYSDIDEAIKAWKRLYYKLNYRKLK